MSDLSTFISRFHDNTNLLKQFDEALRYFKHLSIQEDLEKTQKQLQKLLLILRPISEILKGRLSDTLRFDEQSVIEILQQRHIKDWQHYKEYIITLADKLSSGNTNLTENDYNILNDVADAIDTECANLFRRLSERL
jgi:hypothetical protein